MRKIIILVAVVLFAIFGITDIIHGFITDDPIHYFSEQPRQLLFVAAAGINGGLIALLFYQLSPRWQQKIKLFTLGLAASLVTGFGFYFGWGAIQFWSIQFSFVSSNTLTSSSNTLTYTLTFVFLCIETVAALLWAVFYQAYRKYINTKTCSLA